MKLILYYLLPAPVFHRLACIWIRFFQGSKLSEWKRRRPFHEHRSCDRDMVLMLLLGLLLAVFAGGCASTAKDDWMIPPPVVYDVDENQTEK